MAIKLEKGQKIDLTKGNDELDKILVGLGWDIKKADSNSEFDLDVSIFMLDENGKCKEDGFIYYGNLTSKDGSISRSEDNLTGEGDGDDETVDVELSKIGQEISKVVFAITIHEAKARNQNFGQVGNAFIRIVNKANQEELLKYDLSEDFSIETLLIAGEIYRHNGEWKFSAIGDGMKKELSELCREYGLNI